MIQRRNFIPLLVAGALALGIACGSDGEFVTAVPTTSATTSSDTATPGVTPAVTSQPEATSPPGASVTPEATAAPTGEPTTSATPHVVVTASPDEPVAITAYIPTSELPEAVMTRADGMTFLLPIEVPERSEYSIGLSGRVELGERGMLFWYGAPTTQNFWMFNTHFDLSIAFVDGDARIVEILDMEAESLESRGPDQSYRYAIEAPVGWFAERGIKAGDQAVLDFEVPASIRG